MWIAPFVELEIDPLLSENLTGWTIEFCLKSEIRPICKCTVLENVILNYKVTNYENVSYKTILELLRLTDAGAD